MLSRTFLSAACQNLHARSLGSTSNALFIATRDYAAQSTRALPPNQAIIEMLQKRVFLDTQHGSVGNIEVDLKTLDKVEEESQAERNGYKIRAFANAIKSIQRLDYPVRTATQALEVRFS